jgi:hypothetical protein
MCPLPQAGTLGVMKPQFRGQPRGGHEMKNRPGRASGPRQPWRRQLRAAAIMTAVAAPALLAAACGGTPSSAGSSGTPVAAGATDSRSAIAAARCIRAHGVPNFPDPDSSGQIPKEGPEQLGVSDAVLRAAQTACQNLWPYQPPSQAQQRQQLTDDLKFAQCMRAHGVPNFPDPTNSGGQVEFVFSPSSGFNPHSAQLLAKAHQCLHVLPVGSPLPHASETS